MELTSQGVLHGGTYNANASSVAAANATLATLAADDCAAYKRIERTGGRLIEGLRAARRAAGQRPAGPGPAGGVQHDVRNRPGAQLPRRTLATDRARQRRFLRALQDRGVRVTARGTWFLSAAHDDADIEADARAPPATRSPWSADRLRRRSRPTRRDEDHRGSRRPAGRHAVRAVRARPYRRGPRRHRRHVHDGRGARGLHPRPRGAQAAGQGRRPDPAPLDRAVRQRRRAVRRPGHRGPGDLGHRRRAVGHPRPVGRAADLPAPRRARRATACRSTTPAVAPPTAGRRTRSTAGPARSRTCTPGTRGPRTSPTSCWPRASRP